MRSVSQHNHGVRWTNQQKAFAHHALPEKRRSSDSIKQKVDRLPRVPDSLHQRLNEARSPVDSAPATDSEAVPPGTAHRQLLETTRDTTSPSPVDRGTCRSTVVSDPSKRRADRCQCNRSRHLTWVRTDEAPRCDDLLSSRSPCGVLRSSTLLLDRQSEFLRQLNPNGHSA